MHGFLRWTVSGNEFSDGQLSEARSAPNGSIRPEMNRKGPKYGFSFVVLHEEPSMTGFLRPYPRHRATGSRVRDCEQGLLLRPTLACIAEKLKMQHIDEKPV